MNIILTYETVDGVYKRRQYKTKAGAKKFVDHWMGDGNGGLYGEIGGGGTYMVAFDGVGVVRAEGINLREFYPEAA